MSKTLENLSKAFIGESQARNRYTMYAKVAIKEDLQAVATNFFLTAEQEAEHAKWLMRLIQDLKENDEEIKVPAGVPNILGDTMANLKSAIAGENYEYTDMYPEFADMADEEGYPEIATRLRAIAKAEENHEDRYKKFLTEMEDGSMFKKNEEVAWVCAKCGYVHTSKEAPETCPSCGHPQGYFSVKK